MSIRNFLNLAVLFSTCFILASCSHHTGMVEHVEDGEMEVLDGVEHEMMMHDEHHDDGHMMDAATMAEESRMMGLVHQWIALIDDPAKDLEPFHKVLDSKFVLNFPDTRITNFGQFVRWYQAQESHTHSMSNFSYQKTGNNMYAIQVDLEAGGQQTRQNWTVVDNPKRPYANITSIDVEVLNAETESEADVEAVE